MVQQQEPSNKQFLEAVFKEDAPFAHITDFTYDPGAIPSDRHLSAWKGDWASRYNLSAEPSNQYFTISIFNPDEEGVARRRKALFLRTRVIVLDDVREKLSIEAARLLPEPSYILETSKGSEQWGYILTTPEANRARVENLLDGLVANGLAPDGKDPGMKGATRYVRLPEGYNLKASKANPDGSPYRCRMLEWHPERTVTMEDIAAPFAVDLDAQRREGRVDGAANVPDHPLLQIPDIIHVKEVRSDGRFDITCPWVDEHTDADDSGSAIFTNDDGTAGFKCHHGSCQGRHFGDVVRFVDSQRPGFGERLLNWRVMRTFSDVSTLSFMDPEPQQQQASAPQPVEPVSFMEPAVPPPPAAPTTEDSIQTALDSLRREPHTSPEARGKASDVLKIVEALSTIEQKHWHNEVCDIMRWSKTDFKDIIKDLRNEWYRDASAGTEFYNNLIFIREMNKFYEYNTGIYYSPESFQNSFSDVDAEARKIALQDGRVTKVDKLDFAPKMPLMFVQDGVTYGNTWQAHHTRQGKPGDASRWLGHWDALGWSEHRDHMLKWMAYTIRHPEKKINHALMLGGLEGTGKDFLLYPLVMAMGRYCKIINGDELLQPFNDFMMEAKFLQVNETDLGDHHKAVEISNKVKPLCAAPPHTIRVNQKNVPQIKVRNIINAVMTTNSQMPIRLDGNSRRFYALWTDLNIRDEEGNVLPEWEEYWIDRWDWMEGDGVDACIDYLMNQVDLTGFNPGVAPKVTDFLRDIVDNSQSPMVQTVKAHVEYAAGNFASDIITAQDAMHTLKISGDMHLDNICFVDRKVFSSPSKVARVFRKMGSVQHVRMVHEGHSTRGWIIRNQTKYRNMGPSELYYEYLRQITRARNDPIKPQLAVVN